MPAEDSPIFVARRKRLQSWIDEHFAGEQAAFIGYIRDPGKRVNQGMLSALLKPNGKSFGEKQAEKLERLYRMPPGYLVKALDPIGPSAAANDDDWADVTAYAQAAGMGTGPEAQEWADTHGLKFRRDSLSRKRLKADSLRVMYGAGDSMEPTIREGDAILFDLSDTTPKNRAVYVLLVPGAGAEEYAVKRAVVSKGAINFVSDNLDGDHNWREPRPADGIKIVGRVRWTGGWVK